MSDLTESRPTMTHPLITQLAADPRFAWQPIETAPKDQTKILAYRKDDGLYWEASRSLHHNGYTCPKYLSLLHPTHWMHIPDPTQPNPLLDVVRVLVEGLEFYESLSNYARPVVDTYCNGERVYGLSEVEKYKGAKVAESLSQATKIIGGEG